MFAGSFLSVIRIAASVLKTVLCDPVVLLLILAFPNGRELGDNFIIFSRPPGLAG
jgi:hypothetical protein